MKIATMFSLLPLHLSRSKGSDKPALVLVTLCQAQSEFKNILLHEFAKGRVPKITLQNSRQMSNHKLGRLPSVNMYSL